MRRRTLPKRIFIALLALAWAGYVPAQAPVVDAGQQGSSSRPQSPSRSTSPAGGPSEIVLEMYNQLDSLQREIQNLRGIVEEQSYQIRRMQQEQEDRYLDLDRRLSQLTNPSAGNGLTGPTGGGNGSPAPGAGSQRNRPAGQSPLQGGGNGPGIPTTVSAGDRDAAPAGADELYRSALNLLLEQGSYQQSIQQFRQYVANYPDGSYVPNSWYWLGEALILVENYPQAREAFMTVINDFPEDPKAAGSLLKLGIVQQRMGNLQQARQTWQQISQRYPDSATEIRTAQNYLRDTAQSNN